VFVTDTNFRPNVIFASKVEPLVRLKTNERLTYLNSGGKD
jgi:hypothetical protein